MLRGSNKYYVWDNSDSYTTKNNPEHPEYWIILDEIISSLRGILLFSSVISPVSRPKNGNEKYDNRAQC